MRKFTQWLIMAIAALVAMPSLAATFTEERTDFRDETIYFAMTTRFYDGDPKNNVCSWDKQDVQIAYDDPDWRGDFKGLIEKLDYIKALGFTAIWITPIVQNASGEDYHGYHAMDFSSVDLRYESRTEWGSSEDVKFQDLIDAAHAKGLKIVLDIVLNHNGNFGEATLNPLFTRSQDIRNQANVAASMRPNYDRLPSNYNDLDGTAQYAERFKFFKNPQYDPHNHYHHYGTGWNWDLPNRWWGQIEGDCVDINTENDEVAAYLVNCYGKFIEMGVDGFRIDTTGHIARLTFNKQFIPQFTALGEQYKSKRLNGCPFYMFGECCARAGEVIYRGHHELSSHFYTWKSDQSLLDQYDGSQAYWDTQVLPEGHDSPVGPMVLCESETSFDHSSNNVFMLNGAWHEPDYSEASGFNVIDFPMHYNYNNAQEAVRVANEGDHYYNDASFNVVYVDSHDYCPQPNDKTRFTGGTEQWAENLSMMFTFRGIPCIYYGSEVEFKAGLPIDVGGATNKTPRKDSGRAYFGAYLEGNVTATDFCEYTASGNVAQTLNGDLSQHIIRLNKIRQSVPALRKGQYTFDGCSANGGWAFKRAYKNESYALVAINGGATFTGVPAGTYVDLVTGQSYDGTSGTITVSAPTNKGQLRVLVKDWTGGKVGEDGKFIYTSTPVAHGGSVTFPDEGTSEYYTSDDAVGDPSVKFSPNGGTFKTETLTVSATLNDVAVSGWYQVEGQQKVTLTKGNTSTFTIGSGMSFNQTVTVSWSATGEDGQAYTGTATYKKVDPNATITVYVKGPQGINLYAWGKNGSGTSVEPCGGWPGKTLTETVNVNGDDFYYVTFDDMESVNVIFNRNGSQTGDFTGITEDTYFEYDGGSTATKLDITTTPTPVVKFSPNGGTFVDNVTVTATASNATSAWYKIGNGQQVNINGTATFTLGNDMNVGESVTVSWSASSSSETKTGSVTFTKIEQPTGMTIYYDNSVTNWASVKIHYWGGESATDWPGVDMTKVATNVYMYVVPTGTTGIVFNNGTGDQTDDITNPVDNHIYKGLGNRAWQDGGVYSSGLDSLSLDTDDEPVEYYNIQGIRVENPTPGIYIMRKGNKVQKVRVY